MEIADIKRRVLDTIDRARKSAAERRTRADEGRSRYELFLERIAVAALPPGRQCAPRGRLSLQCLHAWRSVRLMSDRRVRIMSSSPSTHRRRREGDGAYEPQPRRRVIESERPVAARPPAELTEDDVLAFLLRELEPFVDR